MEKNILHVKCFKCDTCHLQLRKTNYQVFTEPITGKTSFHCRYHKLNKEEKVKENIEFCLKFILFYIQDDENNNRSRFGEYRVILFIMTSSTI